MEKIVPEEIRSIFSTFLKEGNSRYMAVQRTAWKCNLTMREVGVILHPKGIKHEPKTSGGHA